MQALGEGMGITLAVHPLSLLGMSIFSNEIVRHETRTSTTVEQTAIIQY